jgi:hypothetical protein
VDANPYQPPSVVDVDQDDQHRVGIRSYHVPFLIAAVCIPLAVAAYTQPELPRDWRAAIGGVASMFLIFDLPVCLLVFWEWMRAGEMPDLNFEPLLPCAERRELYQRWRERPQLADAAFYQTFYAESGFPCETVYGVRREIESIVGRSLAGVHPGDDMGLADVEIDFADVFFRFDRVFKVTIPWRTMAPTIDLTFDSLVRLVAAAQFRAWGP